MPKFLIHYRYAAEKIIVDLRVDGLDELQTQLARLIAEGVDIISVSNLTVLPQPIVGPGGLE